MMDSLNLINALSDAQAEVDHIDFLVFELKDVIRKQEFRKAFLTDVRLPALEKLGTELANAVPTEGEK